MLTVGQAYVATCRGRYVVPHTGPKGARESFDPANYGEIVKPGELVDIVELSPLTLADRRIYKLLVALMRSFQSRLPQCDG